MQNREDHFVSVVVRFGLGGDITPLAISLRDGRTFEVDRVLDIRRASSQKIGGTGIRYLCRIRGKEVALFHDMVDERWFYE